MPEVKARLLLADGTSFEGISFGAQRSVSGEVVFNTGMVGYPEAFTDPSYKGQILALTYPLIGNYGVPKLRSIKGMHSLSENFESENIQITALIVSEFCERPSHWSSVRTLSSWLRSERVPAISGIDTRALTKKLREHGVMLGRVEIENGKNNRGKNLKKLNSKLISKNSALLKSGAAGAAGFEDPNLRNLVAEASTNKPLLYRAGRRCVALVDCGVKHNMVRSLLARKVSVLRVPWDYDLFNGRYDFGAVLVSNGPGDPKTVKATIETASNSIEQGIPTFGICLGNQILALAAGADTYKLKYGHRSQNQPCVVEGTSKCFITSQNHGYAVDESKLQQGWKVWFRNLNDGTVEGLRHKSKPFMSVQFHPEASPGPVDTAFLFDKFLEMMK